jgi:hypothetical protein
MFLHLVLTTVAANRLRVVSMRGAARSVRNLCNDKHNGDFGDGGDVSKSVYEFTWHVYIVHCS